MLIYLFLTDEKKKIFDEYQQEEIQNFRCIFDLFDKDRTGYVSIEDLQTIMQSLQRDPEEAHDLVKSLPQDVGDKLSFEEFLRIMKQLENRLAVAMANKDEEKDDNDEEIEPLEGNVKDRNKFGALLPRTGVHFLPDSKVIDFLK